MGDVPQVLDTKLVKGPEKWNGAKKSWRHWSNKLEGHIAGVSQDLLRLMGAAATHPLEIKLDELPAAAKNLSGTLYSILNGLLEGDAYDTLLNCEKGNGYEVWRVLNTDMKPQGKGHNRNRMMTVIHPTDIQEMQSSHKHKKDLWERRHKDYFARSYLARRALTCRSSASYSHPSSVSLTLRRRNFPSLSSS